jgi:signal peptidase II
VQAAREGEAQSPWAVETESQPPVVHQAALGEPEHATQEIDRKPSPRTALLLMTALAVLVVDQLSKAAAREFLLSRGANSVPLLGEWVRITHVENAGAAFGLLQNQTFLFILIGVIVVAGIVFGHRLLPTHRMTMALCLGLQLGGASGNLIDRLRYDGHVFDFIHVPPWPVFNVADSAIVVGTLILAYHLLFNSTSTQPDRDDHGK